MKRLPLLFSLILLAAIPVAAQEECKCPSAVKSLRESYLESDGIFVGSIERFQLSALRPGMNEAQVRLMGRYKGLDEVKGNVIYVYTPAELAKCGLKLLVGQDYIFYAQGSPARFIVNACSRTGILDNALDDMQELGRLSGKR